MTSTVSFWSRVPLGHNQNSENITLLCLGRARDGLIDISAEAMFYPTLRGASALVQHAQRIRSISIYTDTPAHIHLVMRNVLHSGVPSQLKELDVYLEEPSSGEPPPIRLLPNHPQEDSQTHLPILVQNLHILDLNFPGLDWHRFSFDKLQVLKLSQDAVSCGNVSSLKQLAYIISNSPMLRIMDLEALTWRSAREYPQPISMGSLQTLRINRLEFEGLYDLFRSIAPGSYDIDLNIFEYSFVAGEGPAQQEPIEQGIARLNPLFRRFPNVTTLGFEVEENGSQWVRLWLPQSLQAFPNLKTVHFRSSDLFNPDVADEVLPILTRPPNTINCSYPAIRTIQVSDVTFRDIEAFKAMLASHPIERVELRGCLTVPGGVDGSLLIPGRDSPNPINASSPLYQWLSQNVPQFYCV